MYLIARLVNKNHWGKRATTLCALLFFSVLVQAATYTLPGGALPAGCSSASSTSVTCPSLSLAWADTIVVSNANLTLSITNGLSFGGNNSINSTAAGFKITAQTVNASNNITLKGDITSTGSLTLSSGINSITGNITAGGNVSIGGVLTGTLTTTGSLTPTYATTISGNISATSITSAGGSTYGGSLTATSGDVTSGASDRITGSVSAVNGAVTLKSATTVGGRVSAKNAVILEHAATVSGSVTSTNDGVTLKSSGSSVGGGITAKKTVTLGNSCTVTGDITTDEDVKLDNSGIRVIGNIVAKKKVELSNSTTVTGNVTSTIDDVELKSSGASISSCVTAPSNKAIKLGWAATVGGVCCLSGSTCSTSCVANNSGKATPGLCAAPAPLVAELVAEYRFEDTVYAGVAGEVKDSAGYPGGPFNGSVIGNAKPTAATASPVRPGSCGYASLPGPTSNGGAFSLPNLPVSTTAGATTSVAFWMNWSGTDSVMPIGWRIHDLWLVGGYFGFNTGAGDVYGIASTGLANGWHHVMAVFTNGSVTNNQLYIDGVRQTLSQRQNTPSPSAAVVSSTLQVGGWTNSKGYRFSGSIDELKVWNGTIAPAALPAGYANEAAGKRWDGTTQTCGSAPIAEWRMDETTWNGTAGEVKDSSGNNRNGTAVNGPIPTGSGKVCAAGDFTRVNADQNNNVRDYVNVANSTVDSLTAAVTVMGWVKPVGTVPLSWGNLHYQYVFSNTRDVVALEGTTYKGFELGILGSSPRPQFRLWGVDNAKYEAFGNVVAVGSWVHLAGTYDGQNMKFYINGVLSGTTPYVGSIAAPASTGGTIGAMGMCKSCESNALVDEVKVYDKALTAAQIAFGYSNENAGKNWDGTTRTCAVFPPTSTKPANFNCVETGTNASTGHLYTKLAGTPFSFDVVALKTDGSVETSYASDANKNVTVELVDGSGTTTCDSRAALSPAVSQTLAFASTHAGRKANASMTVAKAYADLRCRVTDANQSPSIVGCSADDFAVRPTGLTVTSSANADTAGASTSNTPIIKTGANFTLTATSGVVGYNYTPKIDASKVAAHSGAVQAGTLAGSFGVANAANAATGTATGAAFTYSEVGYFNVAANGVYDDTFTAVDAATGDCASGFADSGGKYACNFGNASATSYFGRFIPDHFTVTAGALTQGCSAAFTYLGQDGFSTAFTIAAENSANTTTQNYTGSFARLGLTTWGNFVFSAASMPTGSALSASITAPTGSWSNGSASVAAKHQVSRPTAGPVAPANVIVSAKPIDSDGVTSASATAVGSATELRYGRLRALNAYGSERLALSIALQAQYYDAAIGGFKHNTADSCTALSLPAVRTLSAAPPTDGVASRNFYPIVNGGNQLASSDTTASLPATLSGGTANMTLTAPLKRGWIDLILTVPPHLQGNWANCWGQTGTAGVLDDMPCARATFGVYKSPLIYRRENY